MATVLKNTLVTEKSMQLRTQGQYVFEVPLAARKEEIGEAVSEAFNVDVLSVNTVIFKRRGRNTARARGKVVLLKKAYVKIKPDQKIAVLERG